MVISAPVKKALPSLLLSCCLLATVGVQAAPPASAPAPAPLSDGVTQLLIERGLLPQSAAPLVQNMRERASDLVLSAMDFLGVPYRRGGSSAETGFDCSGFTRHVFERTLGLVLPHRADEQAQSSGLQKVERDELKPGDLVFFNTLRRTFSHVGIYVGDGKFIHAPRTGQTVRVEDMREAYWTRRFTGARRVPGMNDGAELLRGTGVSQQP
jgi:cell wall-associated NlpC family hydrolase